MESFDCKGDVEGVERGRDGESSVEVFRPKVLFGRSGERAVSTGPLAVSKVSRAVWSCVNFEGSSSPRANAEETPVEVPEMDVVIGGGGARERIVSVRYIAIRI